MQEGKVAVGEITGYQPAVDILKFSIANSLLDLYAFDHLSADYGITGNINAKNLWRKGRLFVYYTVNLRLVDINGNIIMTFSNKEALNEPDLGKFTDEIAAIIRE